MRQKKLIIIISIVGILLLVGALFYFLKPTAQPIPSGWKTHTNPRYTIGYPSDWKQTKEPAAEGAESVVVKPANIPDDAYDPLLIVTSDVLTDGKEPIEKRELPYEQLGFKKSSIIFQGISATKLQGVLPVPGNDQDPTKTFHNTISTHVYFQKGNVSYYVVYRYPGDVPNDHYERMFEEMLATLQL